MKNLNGGISPTEEEVTLWMEEANVTEGGEIDQDALYGLLIRWYLTAPLERDGGGGCCCGGRPGTKVKQS
eukprot:COSAG04_NODE_1838_length_5437_cov_7.592169_3_plen_70_part_00